MTYENCPRCNGEWIDQGNFNSCKNCDMNIRIDLSINHKWSFIWLRFNKSMVVYWWLDDNTSDICIDTINGNEFIPAPFLPFDITEEQLKLYLTFL